MGGKEARLAAERVSAPTARTSFALYVLLGPAIAVALALAAFSLSREIGEIRSGDLPGLPNGASSSPSSETAAPPGSSQLPAVPTNAPLATPTQRVATSTPAPTARPNDSTPRPTLAPTSTPLPTVLPTSPPILPTLAPPTLPPLGSAPVGVSSAPIGLPSLPIGLPSPPIGLPSQPGLP